MFNNPFKWKIVNIFLIIRLYLLQFKFLYQFKVEISNSVKKQCRLAYNSKFSKIAHILLFKKFFVFNFFI